MQNFKGTADFREPDLMILFDDLRRNYFFIQTEIRLWEFSCKDSGQVKQWSTSLQYLIDIDKKILILKKYNDNNDIDDDDYPSQNIISNHFKTYGNILQIIFTNNDKTYILMFDNDTTVQHVMQQKPNRQHMIASNEDPYNQKWKSPSYSAQST